MDSYVGKIFWDSNLIFKKTGYSHIKQIDHAKKRPVLVVAENEEYFYYIKISSNMGCSSTNVELFNRYGKSKRCFGCIDQIYKKPMCFIKDIQTVGKSNMLETLIMLKIYNEKIDKDEYYDEIKEEIVKLIEEYSNYLEQKTKKLKLK